MKRYSFLARLHFRGRPYDSEGGGGGGGGWHFWLGQIIYFHHVLGRKIYFRVNRGQNIYFQPQQIFEKAKKKKKKKKKKNNSNNKKIEMYSTQSKTFKL